MKQSVVIRIAGDSGDGIQLLGEQLSLTAAIDGMDVRTLPDFPAEIRAPSGTLAGVSGFQLAMAETSIYTAGEDLDVLVVFNPAALKESISSLSKGGLLIINQDSLSDKNWHKVDLEKSYLAEIKSMYHVLELPVVSQTLNAVSALELSQTEAKKTKNFRCEPWRAESEGE